MNFTSKHMASRQEHIKNGGGTIIVLAGDYRQFCEWMYQNVKPENFGKYIYASTADKLRGLRATGVIYVGTFFDRDDYLAVRDVALHRCHYGDPDDV